MSPPVDFRLIVATFLAAGAFLLPFFLGGPSDESVSLTVLVAISVFCLARLRAEGHRNVVGSSSLVLLMIGVVYGIGLLDRPAPVFGINPTSDDYMLVALGMGALLSGALSVRVFFGASDHPVAPISGGRHISFLNDRKLVAIAIGAMSVAVVNYATGGIPVLSGDVNGNRFAGSYGVLGRLWPIILPALQVIVIVSVIRLMTSNKSMLWASLGFLSLLFLILSGGRSLFLIPIIAVGLFAIDFFRPRLRTILLCAASGVGLIGAFGYARTLGSSGSQTDLAYLGSRDQNSWLGTLDISVQTGPRVLSAARETISSNFMSGDFFLADLRSFLGASTPPSDRLVTMLLNRQPDLVGGLPPTLFGGLYLDWGALGVVFGAFVVGFLLELFRQRSRKRMALSTVVWTYYFSTYVLMSVYSYISAKPALFVVAFVCMFAFERDRGRSNEDTNGFKVSRLSGGR